MCATMFVIFFLHYGPFWCYTPERLDRRKVTAVKCIYFLNVVVKQEILIKTQKTKEATFCPVTCNRAPFVTCYCIRIHARIEKMLKNKYSIVWPN